MAHHYTRAVFVLLLLCVFGISVKAQQPVIPNDSVCNAIPIGLLPLPSPCPSGSPGDTVSVSGSLTGAVYNSQDYSPMHCFPGGGPDVWYTFRNSSNAIQVLLEGSNGLDSLFFRVYRSQGSCLELVPLGTWCDSDGDVNEIVSTDGAATTLYYIQVGAGAWSISGDYKLTINSESDCNSCVKQGYVKLLPAPLNGLYNLGDTVAMCAHIDSWDNNATSYLHGVVPQLGSDWNAASITPSFVIPQAGWSWFNNISTPAGTLTGYFYDPDGDLDPTNNAGDPQAVLPNYTACWKVVSNSFCNTYDLGVTVRYYSDDITGTGNSTSVCGSGILMSAQVAQWCCPAFTAVADAISCSSSTGGILVNGNNANTYNYFLLDESDNTLDALYNVTGAGTFTSVGSGTYQVRADNLTIGCSSRKLVKVVGAFDIDIQQTVVGCGSGTGSAIASTNGAVLPVIYDWTNVNTANQNDSLAFNLPDGWAVVKITDNTGCTVIDSIFITSSPLPDGAFSFEEGKRCDAQDTIAVGVAPNVGGGTYTLVAPLIAGISVNANTGEVIVNNPAITPPYQIIVEYAVSNVVCSGTFYDTINFIVRPNAPVPLTATSLTYCQGDTPPTSVILPSGNLIPFWYDNQTQGFGFTTTYTPPLDSNTTPGQYLYGWVFYTDIYAHCISLPTIFSVNVLEAPQVNGYADTAFCPFDTTVIAVYGCSTCVFNWSPVPTSGNATNFYNSTSVGVNTTYTVSVTDVNGCSTSQLVTVLVDPLNTCNESLSQDSIKFYSGITPNGDGINDAWIIDGITSVVNPKVYIFNRWGKMVWEGVDYDNTNVVWRGDDMNGKILPAGTYYFVVDGFLFKKKGWIELSH